MAPQQLGFSAAETSEAVAKALQAVSLTEQAPADPRLLPKGPQAARSYCFSIGYEAAPAHSG